MSRTFFTFLLFIICIDFASASSIPNQGICFYTGTWKEAIAEAKTQNKIIFVDVYTSWCIPCKKMAKNVFTNDTVGDFYNNHFINFKVNAEIGEGIKIASRYGVSVYPSFLYIDPANDSIFLIRSAGSRNKNEFLALGNEALSKSKTANERDAGPSKKRNDLLGDYAKNNDWINYSKEAIDYLTSPSQKSTDEINFIAWEFYQNISDTSSLQKIEVVTENIAKFGRPDYYFLDTHAAILFKLGRKEEALKAAKLAIQKAKDTDEDHTSTTDLIKKIKAMN